MTSATDGSDFTGSVTVYVTGDAGTQAAGSVGSGACTHEGNGYHTYAPAQAETDYDLVAFTFKGTGAVTATVQVFTIPSTGLLAPTVAGRTLDVSAGGEAGVDWANVGSPTTTLNLSGTTVKTATDVETDTADIQSRLPAALTAGGNMKSDVLAISGDTTSADNLEAATDGGTYNVGGGAVVAASVTGAVGSVTGNVGGNVTGTIGGLTAAALKDFFDTDSTTTYGSAVAGSVVKEIADNAGGSALTEAGIADAVWDEVLSGHLTAGTTGEALSNAGSAGDPWATALPGAYGAGTAGKIVGDNINATISSRLAPTTAGRTLDVTTGGEAGIDWANIGSPTTTVNLSGTTVKTATDVETDTADIQTRLPAALVGGRIDANVGAISSDATAADNAEAFFDGTGYAGTNNVIPTVTTVTNQVTANVTGISGDSTAADNAEAFFDGTGYAGTNNVIPTVTTVTNLTNAPTNGDLTATMKASVNAQVLDVMNTDTFAEPGQEAPAATNTLVAKIGYLFKALRNKYTQDATTFKLFADDGTTVDQKATVADSAGTFTRGEIGTGP